MKYRMASLIIHYGISPSTRELQTFPMIQHFDEYSLMVNNKHFFFFLNLQGSLEKVALDENPSW